MLSECQFYPTDPQIQIPDQNSRKPFLKKADFQVYVHTHIHVCMYKRFRITKQH